MILCLNVNSENFNYIFPIKRFKPIAVPLKMSEQTYRVSVHAEGSDSLPHALCCYTELFLKRGPSGEAGL